MKKSKIRIFSIAGTALSVMILMGALAGCGGAGEPTPASSGTTGAINVVSREDGSGTRSAGNVPRTAPPPPGVVLYKINYHVRYPVCHRMSPERRNIMLLPSVRASRSAS